MIVRAAPVKWSKCRQQESASGVERVFFENFETLLLFSAGEGDNLRPKPPGMTSVSKFVPFLVSPGRTTFTM